MKKHYLKTGNKKVMSAVLLAATMMVGLAACGGGNVEESTQPESSVVENSVESSVVESMEADGVEGSDAVDSENETETRTYTLMIDGVETEFEEILFRSEDGFSIWYPAELLQAAEIDGYDGFLQLDAEGDAEISFMIVPTDPALDIDEMLQEAANGYGKDVKATIGEIMELELNTDSEITVKSIDVSYDDVADRFYVVNDGGNAVLITVKANAKVMEEMGAHFDRMALHLEFVAKEAEGSDSAVSGTQVLEVVESTEGQSAGSGEGDSAETKGSEAAGSKGSDAATSK